MSGPVGKRFFPIADLSVSRFMDSVFSVIIESKEKSFNVLNLKFVLITDFILMPQVNMR